MPSGERRPRGREALGFGPVSRRCPVGGPGKQGGSLCSVRCLPLFARPLPEPKAALCEDLSGGRVGVTLAVFQSRGGWSALWPIRSLGALLAPVPHFLSPRAVGGQTMAGKHRTYIFRGILHPETKILPFPSVLICSHCDPFLLRAVGWGVPGAVASWWIQALRSRLGCSQ